MFLLYSDVGIAKAFFAAAATFSATSLTDTQPRAI